MPTLAAPIPARHRPRAKLARAGLATFVVDGLWAMVLTLAFGRTFRQLWQGVGSTALHQDLTKSGALGVVLGLAVHLTVAFGWATVLWVLVTRSAWLRGALSTWRGRLAVAAVYGPLVWIVMSFVVIPLNTGKLPEVTWRWWMQLAGHAAFVALPMIVALTWRDEGARAAPSA